MSAPSVPDASTNGYGQHDDQQRDPYGIVPPAEITEAEQAALGAMMLNPTAVAAVRGIAGVSDFYHPAHQVFAQMLFDLDDAAKPTNPVAVATELDPHDLDRSGGLPYLHKLHASVPTAVNADYYAEKLVEHAHKRATIRAGMRLMQLGKEHNPEFGPDVLPERVQSIIADYDTEVAGTMSGPTVLGEDFDAWFADKLSGQRPTALSTGLVDLDRITDVRPGELLVIAARPSIGKTLLALKLAVNTAREGKPVLLFSLEMTRGELLDRIAAAVCNVEHAHLRDNTLTDDEQRRVRARADELKQLPLYVEDASELSMSQVKATARDYRRRHAIELTVIDYLSLVRPDTSSKDANRERQVAEMTGGAKALAKSLQIPVALVAQINRGPEARADKTPQLSDLRESGSIEADANQVWLLHRPEFTASPEEKDHPENHPGEVQVIVAKNRGGQLGGHWFAFRGSRQDIADMPKN